MYAAIRRYEGIDRGRLDEIRRSVDDEFIPMIREVEGYHGYWIIESGDTLATFSLFESRSGAEESTRMAAEFIREHNLQGALPKAPQVTSGEVLVAGPVHALR
jgi:hypothetical protein